jgi:hypothetical protein
MTITSTSIEALITQPQQQPPYHHHHHHHHAKSIILIERYYNWSELFLINGSYYSQTASNNIKDSHAAQRPLLEMQFE